MVVRCVVISPPQEEVFVLDGDVEVPDTAASAPASVRANLPMGAFGVGAVFMRVDPTQIEVTVLNPLLAGPTLVVYHHAYPHAGYKLHDIARKVLALRPVVDDAPVPILILSSVPGKWSIGRVRSGPAPDASAPALEN